MASECKHAAVPPPVPLVSERVGLGVGLALTFAAGLDVDAESVAAADGGGM